MGVKTLVKAVMPPIIPKVFNYFRSRYGWYGNYASWEQALQQSEGYDADNILKKVKESLLQVKNGQAVYERDSVIFPEIEYSWPLLASIMWIAAQNGGRLNLIDFGGSLGSSYYQNKAFLDKLREVRWNIVEQPAFIVCGKAYFGDNTLKFYESIPECLTETTPNTIIFSSVLQYLEKPYDMLKQILDYQFEYILFDLMPFNYQNFDRLTVQKVNPQIYQASYPCWILHKEKLLNMLAEKYVLVAPFKSDMQIHLDLKTLSYEGFLFRKRF